MTVAMLLPLVVSVLLGASAPRLGRRLPPATAVRLLTAAMLVTALATGFVLAVAGAAGGGADPAGGGAGALVGARAGLRPARTGRRRAAVAAVTVVRAAGRGAAPGGARRAGPRAGRASPAGGSGPRVDGLVVVDDEEPDAYALPGLGGRVVVSTAMLRALPADERRVLLAHEAAHLARRHHLWVQAAELAAAANPLLRPAARRGAGGGRAAGRRGRRRRGRRPRARRAGAGPRRAWRGRRRAPARRCRRSRWPAPTARSPTAPGRCWPGRRRGAGCWPGWWRRLMLATVAAALVTSAETEARFEAAQSAYATCGDRPSRVAVAVGRSRRGAPAACGARASARGFAGTISSTRAANCRAATIATSAGTERADSAPASTPPATAATPCTAANMP